jgi:GLPGLI family protein
MKKILLLLGVLVSITAAQVAFGQTGVITYEVKVNVHRTLPKEREAMKDMIPEFRTSDDQLFFNDTESLYKPVEEEEEEDETVNSGMRMHIQRPMNETYVNQANSKKIRLQEFMGKKYLMEDSLKLMPWKFGSETKEIIGYLCKQASFYHEERKQTIVAWYTDKLRAFLGPENFHTLPGAILQVDINNGERTITAKNIEQRPLKKNELKVPAGGTKTTEDEFRKMVDAQLERMRANGGNVIIRN